jgi:hypothetical protein
LWDQIFNFTGGDEYNVTLNLTQNGQHLTGTVSIYTESATLLSSSKVVGTSITLDWIIPSSSYVMNFEGTINADFKVMTGSFYSDGIKMGTWVATKVN